MSRFFQLGPVLLVSATLGLWLGGVLALSVPMMAFHGIWVSWTYLRFYQTRDDVQGDPGEGFTFADLFPNNMQPVLSDLGLMLNHLQSRLPYRPPLVAVTCASYSGHACRMLIGTCNPMLCPFRVSRPWLRSAPTSTGSPSPAGSSPTSRLCSTCRRTTSSRPRCPATRCPTPTDVGRPPSAISRSDWQVRQLRHYFGLSST